MVVFSLGVMKRNHRPRGRATKQNKSDQKFPPEPRVEESAGPLGAPPLDQAELLKVARSLCARYRQALRRLAR